MKLQKEIFLSFFLGFFLSFYFRAKIDHQKRMRWRKTSTNERNWKTKTKRKFCFCCCFFQKKGRRILSIRMDMFEFRDNIVSAWNDFMILFFGYYSFDDQRQQCFVTFFSYEILVYFLLFLGLIVVWFVMIIMCHKKTCKNRKSFRQEWIFFTLFLVLFRFIWN